MESAQVSAVSAFVFDDAAGSSATAAAAAAASVIAFSLAFTLAPRLRTMYRSTVVLLSACDLVWLSLSKDERRNPHALPL